MNSRSSVEIALNRQCTSFSAQAGVDGLSLFTDTPVRFSVYADGQRLWQSAALGHEDPPHGRAGPSRRTQDAAAGGREGRAGQPADAGELGRRSDQLPVRTVVSVAANAAGVRAAPACSSRP